MTQPERSFERLRELFDRLVDLRAEDREDAFARETEGNPALEAELRALLANADRSATTFDNASLLFTGWTEPPLPAIAGFRLHRRIGSGGSATVYLADQERPDFTRTVALKVIDRIVDAALLRPMREEQRILARLEHAGIARLYDAGVTSLGQPYLAMEHVEGTTIVEHCRLHELSIRERIELFLSVLDAVRYAHEQAIVHRDLKPANILVSSRGEAKLLDFGIAKLVAPGDEDKTLTLNRAMTPAYASPEQRRGGRITPASDIYSLGVVLYELLANTIPFRIEDTTHEHDPQPPSAVFEGSDARWRRTLRGDLDAVVLKALRYDPEDRYASAEALADDLRRVLAGRPVAARGDDRVYRIGRFVRRYRVAFAAVAAALIVALLFVPWRIAKKASVPNELAIFYDAGLSDAAQKLARFEGAAARDDFRRAGETAIAWDGVARAESILGEVGRAGDAARRAESLLPAAKLPRDEVARIRAASFAAKHEWPKAIAALEELFAREPERVDIGVALVSTLAASGRSEAADAALGRLRQLQSDPRIDLVEAQVAYQLSEYQRAAAAAARARATAQQLAAAPLVLRAERLHAEAMSRLDQRDQARRALESLIARDTAAGLARETAAAQLALGAILLGSGPQEETDKTLRAALAGLRAAGDVRGQVTAQMLLAQHEAKSDLAKGLARARTAVAEARRIGDRWAEGNALTQLMTLLDWAEDDAGRAALLEPALTALRDSGNRFILMWTLANHSVPAIEALDLDRAEAYLTEAEALAPKVGSDFARAIIDRARAVLAQTRGDLDLARERYMAALQRAGGARMVHNRGTFLAELAWLEVAAERPDAAAARAKEAIDALTAVGAVGEAAAIDGGVLAWCDARRGDAASARRRLTTLRKAADDGSASRFWYLVAEARVAAELGEWRRAVELRRETVRIAAKDEPRRVLMLQQVDLATALARVGDRREAQRLVDELLPEAERLGLNGIARELRKLR